MFEWDIQPYRVPELLTMGLLLVLAVLLPARAREQAWTRVRVALDRLGPRGPLWAASVTLAFALAALGVYRHAPAILDEGAFLLIADTLLHGRLGNPTHPMWVSFETFHVFHEPTYAAKYPPLPGAVLALGQLVAGDPIIGVKLCLAAAIAATAWALAAWLPQRLALLGALLLALQTGCLSYWSQSYWGGAAPALGGALVLGGAGRLFTALPRRRDGALAALGACLLATSRPYEGLLLTAPLTLALLVHWRRQSHPLAWLSRVLPGVAVLAAGAAFVLAYNRALTGSPWVFPYDVYSAKYGLARPFVWQTPGDVAFTHPDMRRMAEEFEAALYVRSVTRMWSPMLRFYFGPLLLLPCLFAPWLLRRRDALLVATAGLGLAGMLLTTYVGPHYAAPFAALLVLIVLKNLQALAALRWRGRPLGRALVFGLLVAWLGTWALATTETAFAAARLHDERPLASERVRLERELAATGEKHLVFVRYGRSHYTGDEWVYNPADLDAAPVLFARETNPAQDGKLLDYFADRHVWRVSVHRASIEPPVRLR